MRVDDGQDIPRYTNNEKKAEKTNLERWAKKSDPQSVTIETDNKKGTTKVTLGDLYKQLNDDSSEDI